VKGEKEKAGRQWEKGAGKVVKCQEGATTSSTGAEGVLETGRGAA